MIAEREPYRLQRRYNHMKPVDVEIWEAFLRAYPNAYESVIYDQPVGTGSPIPEGTPDNIALDMKMLTQWKIDVVGFIDDEVHVIEIKPDAGLSALGQVLGYAYLFRKEHPEHSKVVPVILTNQIRPDMPELTKAQGVRLMTP